MVSVHSCAAEFWPLRLLFLVLSCLADRRQAAEKQAEKAGKTVSVLKAALASKEAELHGQHEELVRLLQAEDTRARVEAVEGKRLRALAGSLLCNFWLL